MLVTMRRGLFTLLLLKAQYLILARAIVSILYSKFGASPWSAKYQTICVPIIDIFQIIKAKCRQIKHTQMGPSN
jgi:hypothetical protein